MAAVGTPQQTHTTRSSNGSSSDPSSRSKAAAIASAALTAAALIGGDAAMAAVVAAVRHGVDGALLQGAIAGGVIAIGSYALVGVPQIRLGRKQTATTQQQGQKDRRTRWALARLAANTPAAFLVASVVAGPLAVGLVTGRTHDAHPHTKTAAAAAVFGITWAAIYLGALSAIF